MGTVNSSGNSAAPAARDPSLPTVLQVLPALATGGVERGTIDIALALKAAGWSSIVASSGGAMVNELDRGGVTHITLPLQSKNPFVMRSNASALVRLIREHQVDIIHARSRAPAWSALSAARRTGAHFVTTFHGTYNAQNFFKRRYNAVMARGERVIAISDFIARHVQERYGTDPARIRTVPRGVDVGIFDPAAVPAVRMIALATAWRLPDGMPVVMLPGRLTRWKGQAVLIDALAELGRSDVRCLIVGSDQGRTGYREELEQQVAARNLGSVVHIVDHCRDMAAAYMLADVVVSASTDPEAFGRVAAEAQAMGRPVVATDHGGSRETVVPGETGWLVRPGSPSDMAQAIREALGLNARNRAVMAAKARAHVLENFTVARMQDQTLAVYREVLEAG